MHSIPKYFMTICECILSDDSLEHIKTVQKLLQKGTNVRSDNEIVEMLLKYIVSGDDSSSLDDFTQIDQYFLVHPDFLQSFSSEIMISATFHLNS